MSAPEAFALSEVLGALSYALDITEGEPPGHAVRTLAIGMRLAEELRLGDDVRSALFYALLLKDAGCSSNASRLSSLFQADDQPAKHAMKRVDWSRSGSLAMYTWRAIEPGGSPLAKARRLRAITREDEVTRDVIGTRCERGAEIARMLELPEPTAEAIRALDEHWDGSGHPRGLRGEEIPLLGRILCLSQSAERPYRPRCRPTRRSPSCTTCAGPRCARPRWPASRTRSPGRPSWLRSPHMKVSVRLFAGLRERAGGQHVEVELPEGARVEDLLAAMGSTPVGPLAPGQCVVAINREYAPRTEPIREGDEVALIPPVSGGAGPAVSDAVVRRVRVTGEPLDVAALSAAVRDPRAGAVVLFEGVTREVASLDYEAYAEMAVQRLRAIGEEEAARHGLCAVALEHRVGTVPLGEPSVIVAASAPHRGDAFTGARALIDRVKAEAPIWKVEVTEDGARRVEGALPPVPDG